MPRQLLGFFSPLLFLKYDFTFLSCSEVRTFPLRWQYPYALMYFTQLTLTSFSLQDRKRQFLFILLSMKSGENHCILFVILSVLIFAQWDWKVIAGPWTFLETMVYGWRKKRTIYPQKNSESWQRMYIDLVSVHVPQNWPKNCLGLSGSRLWRALIAHRLKDIHELQLIFTAKYQYNFKSHKFRDTE